MQTNIIRRDAEIIGAPDEPGHNVVSPLCDSYYDIVYNSLEAKIMLASYLLCDTRSDNRRFY